MYISALEIKETISTIIIPTQKDRNINFICVIIKTNEKFYLLDHIKDGI